MSARYWTDDEELTPAAMNELEASSLMTFADAAARDAFLVGDLAPVPGMHVFMLDANMSLTYLNPGIPGWYPNPGTLCFAAYQTAGQSLASLTNVALTGFTVVAGRNLNGWFTPATGKFKPTLPGLYEFTGGVGTTTSPTAAPFHRCGLRLNGTGSAAFIAASEHRQVTNASMAVGFGVRRFTLALNGATDFVELVALAGVATATSTGVLASSFTAKYVGQ